MKGIINKGIQELVETRFGAATWEKVKDLAGCDEPFFAISQDYPEEMSLALIKAAAQVSGLSLEEIQVEFGKFLVPNTLKKCYATYVVMAGSSAQEFLLNMDRVHSDVTRTINNAHPPKFAYEKCGPHCLRMHYHSERGFCAVLRGLILGVGILFDQELEVHEIACTHRGDPHCIMEVRFP